MPSIEEIVMINPKLKNWYLHQGITEQKVTDSIFMSFEKKSIKIHLSGFVEGHPGFKNGDHITTSQIVGIKGNVIRTLSGTEYELVNPLPEYEAKYPNALERLKVSLNQQFRRTDFTELRAL